MDDICYILEDDSVAHPSEVTADDNGVLRHKDGLAVACAPHGPRTRAASHQALTAAAKKREADAAAAKKDEKPAKGATTREMKPSATKPGYETKSAG